MTERINHAAEARLCGQRAEQAPTEAEALNQLVSAQAHATLALVEQQRIANLIALHAHEVRYDIGEWSRIYDYDAEGEAFLSPDIASALRVDNEETRTA